MPYLPVNVLEKIFNPNPQILGVIIRLLQQEFLKRCWNVLKPEGQLVVASDVVSLIHWMQNVLEKAYRILFEGAKYCLPSTMAYIWPHELPVSYLWKKGCGQNLFYTEKIP